MTRSMALLVGSLFCLAVGCSDDGGKFDGIIGNSDLGSGTDGGGGGGTDGGGGPGLCKGAGCIGAACKDASECTEGKAGTTKICWKTNLLDKADYVLTPGGYCTQECTTNDDCGTGTCFHPAGETKSYCLASCSDGSTCRHPIDNKRGYACVYQGSSGVCYPDQNLDCQPSVGTCDVTLQDMSKVAGGCIRTAFEDLGLCHIACKVGTQTCPDDTRFGTSGAAKQHCIFVDATVDFAGNNTGDKFRGPVCYHTRSMPTADGDKCSYFDQCVDGDECDLLNLMESQRVCRRLCAQGNGMQPSKLYKDPKGTAFDNTCPSGTVCGDPLRAGMGNGSPGLCLPQ